MNNNLCTASSRRAWQYCEITKFRKLTKLYAYFEGKLALSFWINLQNYFLQIYQGLSEIPPRRIFKFMLGIFGNLRDLQLAKCFLILKLFKLTNFNKLVLIFQRKISLEIL